MSTTLPSYSTTGNIMGKPGYFKNMGVQSIAALITAVFAVTMISQLLKFGNIAPEMAYQAFREDNASFSNPDRGWYRVENTSAINPELQPEYKNDNAALVFLEADLGDFLTGPFSAEKFDEIRRAFEYARKAGVSVIFRAAYDFEGKDSPEPADAKVILGHINQLKPIFYEFEDILLSIQAGLLGPWGEWHSSRYGDPIEPDVQRLIVNALLNASPESVTVAVRRPVYVRTITGSRTLTAAEAFSGVKLARVAYHNDAILSDESDMGTYSDPDWTREDEMKWTNNHAAFTPLVAETNMPSRYNDAGNAVKILDTMNLQALNAEYHPDVLQKWKRSYYRGMNAYDYIGGRMGYRFTLSLAGFSKAPRRGGTLRLRLELRNTGFGNLMKQKRFEIVLKNGYRTYRAAIDDDPRRWYKNKKITRDFSFSLPSDMPAGDWDVYLGLTSAFDSLKDNPAYSVRFANAGVWNEQFGLNLIGSVSVAETGGSDGVTEFRQIGV